MQKLLLIREGTGRCRKAVLLYGACEQNTKAEKDAQTA